MGGNHRKSRTTFTKRVHNLSAIHWIKYPISLLTLVVIGKLPKPLSTFSKKLIIDILFPNRNPNIKYNRLYKILRTGVQHVLISFLQSVKKYLGTVPKNII